MLSIQDRVYFLKCAAVLKSHKTFPIVLKSALWQPRTYDLSWSCLMYLFFLCSFLAEWWMFITVINLLRTEVDFGWVRPSFPSSIFWIDDSGWLNALFLYVIYRPGVKSTLHYRGNKSETPKVLLLISGITLLVPQNSEKNQIYIIIYTANQLNY